MMSTKTYTALTDARVAAIAHETQRAITARAESVKTSRGLSFRVMADELAMNYSNLSNRFQGRADWTITDVVAFRRRFGVDLMEGL